MLLINKISQNLCYAAVLFILCVTYYFSTAYMTVATFAYFLLVLGLLFRKEKKIHATLMTTGIVLDIALVLLLQLQREAIQTASSFSLGFYEQVHIASSSLAILFYIPVLYIGFALYRGSLKGPKARSWHLRLGISAFVLRSIGFVLMFSLLDSLSN